MLILFLTCSILSIYHLVILHMNKKYNLLQPLCKMCSNPVKMDYTNKQWRIYCSRSCAATDKEFQLNKAKQTNLERYGFENAFQNKVLQEKQKQTNLEKYGVKNPRQTDSIKRKIKLTKLKKYGDEKYNNREKAKITCLEVYDVEHVGRNKEIQEKIKQTNLERYGVEYFPNREVSKQTMLLRYGVEYSGQSAELTKKRENTCLNRYGVISPTAAEAIKTKIKQTNLKNHGGVHSSQQHMSGIISLLNDENWINNHYVVKPTTAKQLAEDVGTTGTTLLRYIHDHDIKIKPQSKKSAVCARWLNHISNEHQIILEHEYRIPKTQYSADGYHRETNTIYEFHGDFYHGNPSKYNPEFLNTKANKTMGELYQKTIERENKIRSLGYNLVVMWESDFIQMVDSHR